MNDHTENDAGKLEWSAPQIDLTAATEAENGSSVGGDITLAS
ncbi:hypothetical protein [Brevundimonas vitis]|nr:hypothetical protein [Brevundimonas vitisensis]